MPDIWPTGPLEVVLTYVPDGPPADSAVVDPDAAIEAEEDATVAA